MDQSDQLKDACKQLYEARVHIRKILSFVVLYDEGCDDVYIYDLEGCAQAVRDALDFIENDEDMTLPHLPETPENGEIELETLTDAEMYERRFNPLGHISESEKTGNGADLALKVDANLKSAFVVGPRRSERIVCKNCEEVLTYNVAARQFLGQKPTPVTLSCEAHCSICDEAI
jgi:hypothetical protein